MKPKVEDIQHKYEAYQRYYSKLHDEQKEIDEYYELDYDAGVPENYATRMPPTAREWVDAGVRHFTLDNPKAKVPLRKDSEAARNQVALLETFYNFWLSEGILTIKRGAKKLLKRGELFLKVNMDDTYFGSDSEERLFHFPLLLTTPDPINTFCSPAHNGLVPYDVIECFNMSVAEAQALASSQGWKWETTKEPDKLVKWFSYISPEWRYFSLDDEPVLTPEVQPNILGMTPYVHIGAGYGDDNYEGKPEYQYRSLLWSKRDMLKMEVRVLSALDAINARYAWPRYKAKGDPDVIKKIYPYGVPTDPDQWLYEIPDQMEIETLQGEQPPPALFQQYAMLQTQSTPPEVLGGVRPAGVYSGQHQEALMATAKPIYKDPFKNYEDGLGVAMGMGARIIETVYNYPVQIKNFAGDTGGYITIRPKDIRGHYDCDVHLLAESPEATDVRKALGKGLRQGGSISHKTELRQYHDMSEKEAEDEMAQQLAEMIMAQPGVLEPVVKDALTRLGMHKELEALEEVEARMTKGNPPVPQGEGINMDMVTQRGRTTPGVSSVPTPHETMTRERV